MSWSLGNRTEVYQGVLTICLEEGAADVFHYFLLGFILTGLGISMALLACVVVQARAVVKRRDKAGEMDRSASDRYHNLRRRKSGISTCGPYQDPPEPSGEWTLPRQEDPASAYEFLSEDVKNHMRQQEAEASLARHRSSSGELDRVLSRSSSSSSQEGDQSKEADQLLQLLANPNMYRKASTTKGLEPGIGMLMQSVFQITGSVATVEPPPAPPAPASRPHRSRSTTVSTMMRQRRSVQFSSVLEEVQEREQPGLDDIVEEEGEGRRPAGGRQEEGEGRRRAGGQEDSEGRRRARSLSGGASITEGRDYRL